MIVSLIGFRGSGKSAVGCLLAQRLSLEFIDADLEIERKEQKTIPEIFAEQGEKYFRESEAETMQSIYSKDNLVVATGGGAVLNVQTQKLLQQKGTVIWLQADLATTIQRITTDQKKGTSRPALTDLDFNQEVATLLQQREPIYKAVSDFHIDTVGKSLEQIVKKIIQKLNSDERSSNDS